MTKLPKLTALTLATLLHDPVDAQERKPAAEWITVATGALPIILSAPHGGRAAIPELAPRRGVGVPQFTIERDSNTAELAEALAGKLGVRLGALPFRVIARFERKYDTARTYGSHREGGVDSIQLEFGANLRAKSNLERTADDLARAIEIFARAYLPLAASGAKETSAAQP